MILSIVCLVALLAQGYLFARERAEWAAQREREAREHRDQVQTLLNQIKPETAQPVMPPEYTLPQAVDLESDEAFWESKEQLAQRIAEEEALNG